MGNPNSVIKYVFGEVVIGVFKPIDFFLLFALCVKEGGKAGGVVGKGGGVIVYCFSVL